MGLILIRVGPLIPSVSIGLKTNHMTSLGSISTSTRTQSSAFSTNYNVLHLEEIDLTPSGVVEAWNKLVYRVPEEEDFNKGWQELGAWLVSEPDVWLYLETQWYPLREEFARYAIKNYRNYGLTATSLVEGSHAVLKRGIKSRWIDALTLFKAIKSAVDTQKTEYEGKLAKEDERAKQRYTRLRIFRGLATKISWKGFEVMYQLAKRTTERFDKDQAGVPGQALRPCTNTFWRQWGLPCGHTIWQRLAANEPLTLDDIDAHWYLRRTTPVAETREALLNEPDPRTIPSRRRPANQPLTRARDHHSTRRDPSS